MSVSGPATPLSEADLIPDRALDSKEDDRFQHAPIAARVADLVISAEPPVNIALFGAWGSGKSSFGSLLKAEVESRRKGVKFITFDAWAYSGEPLQRNFISHVAAALGFDPESDEGRPFSRGLYQKSRSGHVNIGAIGWRRFVSYLGMAFLILVVLVMALGIAIGLVAAVFNGKPTDEIGKTLPGLLPASVVGALLGALVTQIFGGLKVDLEEGEPTAEQLRARFFELVDLATQSKLKGGKGHNRLVFFIDELDRCPRERVAETLAAIRSFFGEKHCVFVVAADRDVLAAALKDPERAVPIDTSNPYRSSASEFFDKVFQFQLALPPLRGARLSRFARQLVEQRGGLWAELRTSEPDGRAVDRVLYALIPSHVRSPRRVKVLLNNFAANARIAASRGLDWLERAPEIAKLTALETEFPLFAADLPQAPGLPTLLLNSPSNPNRRIADLLEKHRLVAEHGVPLEPGTGAPSPEAATASGTPTPTSGGAATSTAPQDAEPLTPADATTMVACDQEREILEAQRAQLRRYLVRVQEVHDPGRDLLFLERAATTVALRNEDLGQLIEDVAVDNPEEVSEAVAREPEDERRKAVQLLAQLVPNEIGQERNNVLTALVEVAETLNYDLGPAGREAVGAIEQLRADRDLGDDQLVPALRLALRNHGRLLVRHLLADDRLLQAVDRTTQVACMADQLDEPTRKRVWARVAGGIRSSESMLLEPLAVLPADVARELLSAASDDVGDHWSSLADSEQERLGASLLRTIEERSDFDAELLADAAWALLATEEAALYDVVRDDADLWRLVTPVARRGLALSALSLAGPDDWPLLAERVGDETASADTSDEAVAVIARALGENATFTEDTPFAALSAALAPLARLASPEPSSTIGPAIPALFTARPWQLPLQPVRTMLYNGVAPLASISPQVADVVHQAIVDDIERGLAGAATAPGAAVATLALAHVPHVASILPGPALGRLAGHLGVAPATPALEVELVRAQITVARAARGAGAPLDATVAPDPAAVLEILPSDPSYLARWLESLPPPVQIASVVPELVAHPVRGQTAAFQTWAAATTEDERTEIAKTMLDHVPGPEELFRAVAGQGVTETIIVERLTAAIQTEGTASRRKDIGDLLLAMEPRTPAREEAVVSLIIWTLARNTKGDVSNAIRLLEALPATTHTRTRLSRAFTDAYRATGFLVTGTALTILASHGMPVPRPPRIRFGRR